MSDLISREGLIETIRAEMARAEKRETEAAENGDDVGRFGFYAVYRLYQKMIKTVKDEPAVKGEPEKQDKGEWCWLGCTDNGLKEGEYMCSECKHRVVTYNSKPWEHFCPSCGADMREEG